MHSELQHFQDELLHHECHQRLNSLQASAALLQRSKDTAPAPDRRKTRHLHLLQTAGGIPLCQTLGQFQPLTKHTEIQNKSAKALEITKECTWSYFNRVPLVISIKYILNVYAHMHISHTFYAYSLSIPRKPVYLHTVDWWPLHTASVSPLVANMSPSPWSPHLSISHKDEEDNHFVNYPSCPRTPI